MKKLLSCLILAALVLCLVPTASAAGGAYMSGPTTVRAGDTISVTFYAGGGIHGGNGSISYDSSVLTYQGYSQLVGGSYALEFGGSYFLFYDNSMASPIEGYAGIFRMNFTVNANVAPGTTFSVSATGVTLSAGESDIGVGTVSYTATIAEPLSDNCSLKSMTVTGANITPAFSPAVTNYSASVPFTTGSVTVSAEAEHPGAKVSVSNPALTPGGTTFVQVTVTAENGTTKTYSIAIARAQDPNYVESDNAYLSSLSVEGYTLSPVFDKNVTQYYVWLPYEAESVSLFAEVEDEKASVVIGTVETLTPGAGTNIPVTVTAENDAQKVYTVTVVRAPEHEKAEAYINGQREIPEEPVEEPVVEETEPATEPTEAPVVQTPVTPTEVPTGYSLTTLIITAVVAALLGAGVMALIKFRRKKLFDSSL